MPRRPRPDFTHTYHHVIVRGLDGLPIFDSDRKKQHYLDLMKDVRSTHDMSLYAFGFLNNHVHQLVRRNDQSIGRFYRRVNGRFAQWYNHVFDRSGGLYDGRYFSSLIDSDNYLEPVWRYIHRQGVEAGLYETPVQDPWNTASLYEDGDEQFNWIDWEEACQELIGEEQRDELPSAFNTDEIDDWFNEGPPRQRKRNQVFLADDDFVEKYMQIRKEDVRENDRGESPVSWSRLETIAQSESELSSEQLLKRSKETNRHYWRKGLAYAGRRYAHLSVSELSDKLNVSPSAISRMIKKAKKDKELKEWWDEKFK